MTKPLVNVIIPTYNYADKVGRAIESVRSQTLSNFACYIVDDGSTDDTARVVQEAISGDDRFRYVYQNNSGVAEARNKGVFSGDAPYICCLDADDAIKPEFLEVCVKELEKDRSIGIAYTGLWYIKPDGSEGLSPWPGEFNYDKQLEGQNQIPTCNVSRRVIWERLGGQRQRYAPHGAGEEDAEMWLRAGAYGFRGKLVTKAGFFVYSWMSGRVSGNRQHSITNYRMWHPWVSDKKHPFMSVATPARMSHPVRQYDNPVISVIIPVGPGHEKSVIDSLDSLEGQTFRKWEAIIAWDSPASYEHIQKSYPYANIINVGNSLGAGAARNRGADAARAPLLFFLDADDYLFPETLETLLKAWENSGVIVYSDYVGKAEIDPSEIGKFKDRLLFYDEKLNLAVLSHKSKDYACEKASHQPDVDLYIWCLVSAIVPRKWHFDIGGFDENMKSWEDWDYYIRMAKAGKCFIRVPKELVVYRFYSGSRRDEGVKEHQELLKYMTQKYRSIQNMGCNCGNKKTINVVMSEVERRSSMPSGIGNDSDYVMIRYEHPNVGQHRVIGPASGMGYGYRSGGERFLVRRDDAAMSPLFVEEEMRVEIEQETTSMPAPPSDLPEPVALEESQGYTLEDIAGMTKGAANALRSRGINTLEALVKLDEGDLRAIRGIGPAKASLILRYARGMLNA